MCDRHKNYEPSSRFIHEDVNCFRTKPKEWEHHPLDENNMYLLPYEKQEEANNKINAKIGELNEKRAERSDEIIHQKIKCEMVSDDEYWEMVDTVESNDLYCVQLHEMVSTLETYIRWNSYYEGRKNCYALGFEIQSKIKCQNCRHGMNSHNGEYYESFCGSGDQCKGLKLSEKNKLKLQRLSGTLPTLDGDPVPEPREVESVEELFTPHEPEAIEKKTTLEEFT